jgi:hypothetical protein
MKHYLALFLLLFIVKANQAQEVSKITVPASPAFSILNFEPSAIMRPTNARALASDILNSFDKDGNLLLNLGLEVAPYWLKSRPNLSRETYLRPSLPQTFLQSFSLSAATVKDTITGGNRLGAGFRFKLYNGEPVEELAEASNQLKTRTTVVAVINGINTMVGGEMNTKAKAVDAIVNGLNRSNVDQAVVNEVINAANTLAPSYSDSVTDIRAFLTRLIEDRVAAYTELSKIVSDLLYQRKGFMLEFAGATGHNITNGSGLEKLGIWGNASYFVSADDLLSLTARFMNQEGGILDSALTNFDVGFGYLKKTAKYNISVEGMMRWYRAEVKDLNSSNQPITRLEKDFTYRLAVQGSFAISKEVSINLSFGKEFNTPFISRSGYFSILGVNYSLFSKVPNTLE